jgi:hypothetical protein
MNTETCTIPGVEKAQTLHEVAHAIGDSRVRIHYGPFWPQPGSRRLD